MKKITIVTTSQPVANPRAVKEAITLSENNYSVTFIYNVTLNWGDEGDKKIISKYPGINWVQAGKSLHLHSVYEKYKRLRRKFNEIMLRTGVNSPFAENSLVLLAQELYKKSLLIETDFYIGHNLGALPVVAKAAKKKKIPYAFDAEDYHRGESATDSKRAHLVAQIENSFLGNARYITASSPLIAALYQKNFPSVPILPVLNVFSVKKAAKVITPVGHYLKLIWFSQTVGVGRGIEDIVSAICDLPEASVKLTLLGYITDEYKQKLIKLAAGKKDNLNFMQPVSDEEIFEIVKQHDIGLALEPGRDLNNDIALSNKIFTYLLCANAVVFTSTSAQKLFYESHPNVGAMYSAGAVIELTEILQEYVNNPALVNLQKSFALQLAKDICNWEMNQQNFLNLISEALN